MNESITWGLRSAEFKSHKDLSKFVKERLINSRDISSIVYDSNKKMFVLFYWGYPEK